MRNRLWTFLAAGALLLLSTPALAADCDLISTRTAGTYTIKTFFLLDSDTAASTGTLCDLNTFGSPEFLRYSVQSESGADAGYSVLLWGRDTSGGLQHQLGAGLLDGNAPFERKSESLPAPLPRHVQAQSFALGTATDFDVIAEAWIRNDPGNAPVSSLEAHVILCGQADENGTIFLGPATAAFGGDGSDASIGSTACDALDSATEATADAPILTDVAFGVVGGRCHTDGTLGAGETVAFTMRSATADTSPEQTCTISEAESVCTLTTPTDTDVAAGATVAMEAAQSSDNSDDNLWCEVTIAIR